MSDIAVMYMIWFPVQVLLGLAWFYLMNAFEVERAERPRLKRAVMIAYFVWAWMPLMYVLVAG